MLNNSFSSDHSSVYNQIWEEADDLEWILKNVMSRVERMYCKLVVSLQEKLVRLTVLFILLWGCRYGVSSNGIDHLIQYLQFFGLTWSTQFVLANVLAYFLRFTWPKRNSI